MAYIIALTIVLFKIAVLFLFGYGFFSSKGWREKVIVLILFFFYYLSNVAIMVMLLSNSYKSNSAFISEINHNLMEIQASTHIIDLINLPKSLSLGAFILTYIIILAPLGTLNFLHFICSFVYVIFAGSLWAVYLRSRKEAQLEDVTLINKQMEK